MSGASISYPHHRCCRHHHHHDGPSSTASALLGESPSPPQSRPDLRLGHVVAMAACYNPAYELPPHPQRTVQVPPQQKDYTRPLHVDCSVEYELPNAAKPPQGQRAEPLLMIHPCYFRKIESQRRSPFVNNLPQPAAAAVAAAAAKRRASAAAARLQPLPAAPYPAQHQLWEQPAVPNLYCKRDQLAAGGALGGGDHWTDPERSPDRPEDNNNRHILSGKYRQYLRAHRLHPYVTSAIPLASTFPQIQQVCYNV